MLFGLYFILTAWLVPGLPLWFSIVNTVIGSLIIVTTTVKIVIRNSLQ